jgi:hypothetical protein
MDVLYERVAGIDIGKKTLTCCVRTPGKDGARHSETRTYRTMTRSVGVLAEWDGSQVPIGSELGATWMRRCICSNASAS